MAQRGCAASKDISIDFHYPVTVLCGKNGSGKSTILLSALLAFHSARTDLPPHQQRLRAVRPHFTFGDFFFQGPHDAAISGVSIDWLYSSGRTQNATHSAKRWLQYDRREHKGTHYLGVARVVPALEQRVLRSYFKASFQVTKANTTHLTAPFREYYSDILAREYAAVDKVASKSSRHSLSILRSGVSYSSYNSGVGEDALATILYELQECKPGSFIAIEEIEAGLHPEAQKRLAEKLHVIADDKALQIVITSHSATFIDAVPRDARILLQRTGEQFVATSKVTTRYAMADLDGEKHSELVVYCEDAFAQSLIEAALSDSQKQRVVVLPIGSDATLAEQLASHALSKFRQKAVIFWDGDVRKKPLEVKNWLRKAEQRARNLEGIANWAFLPGTVEPEKWCLNSLDPVSSAAAFASAFDL